jgi:hypothetical protein
MPNKQNNERRYTGGGPRPDLRKLRQDEAKERQAAWDKLTPQEQLKALDGRPGGSKRQRARLEAIIERAKHPQPKVKQTKPIEAVTDGTGERLKAKTRRAQEQSKRPGADKRGV